MSRWPDFAAAVLNESMSIMAGGSGTAPVMPAAPSQSFTVNRREHHAALREASGMFLESLKVIDLSPGATSHFVPLTEEDDKIVVNGIPFSKRHFARNYEQQFAADVQAFYCQTYGFVGVNAQLTDAGLELTFTLDTDT
jgi:hypothetical protein